MNQLAENENGKIYTEKKNFLIVTNFYIHKTIHKTLIPEYIAKLDAPITEEEVKKQYLKCQQVRARLDGIPIDFYQEFWDLIV